MTLLTKFRLTLATFVFLAIAFFVKAYGWTPAYQQGDTPGFFAPVTTEYMDVCKVDLLKPGAHDQISLCSHP